MNRPDPRFIARYLDGSSTAEEARRVEAWLEASADHRRELEEQRAVWELAGSRVGRRAAYEQSTAAAWHRLRRSQPSQPRRSTRVDRPVVHKKTARRFRIATAAAVLLAAATWITLQTRTDDPVTAAELQEVATQPGQRARVPLGDGTFVRLNVASAIRYPETFDGDRREVYLEGEAFFEVSDDASRPFVVHTSDALVTVLGTAFNVRAYDGDEHVDVVVARGRVALQSESQTDSLRVVLTADQMGRVRDRRPERITERVDVQRHLAWMEGRLIFEDTPLREAVVELERWYTLDVRIDDPEMADWRLTASFKNESIEEILAVIASALNVEYRRDREIVTFYR